MSSIIYLLNNDTDVEVLEFDLMKEEDSQVKQIQPSKIQQNFVQESQEVQDTSEVEDIIIDKLLEENNLDELRNAIMTNTDNQAFRQLAKVFNAASHRLGQLERNYDGSFLNNQISQKVILEAQFIGLMGLFLEVKDDLTYSVRRASISYSIKLQIDQNLICLVYSMIVAKLNKKYKCQYILHRLMAFLLLDSNVYFKTISSKEIFDYIVTMIIQSFTGSVEIQVIKILGYLYVSNVEYALENMQYLQLIRNTIQILYRFLDNPKNQSINLPEQIIKLLILVLSGDMYTKLQDLCIYQSIYQTLRKQCPVFSSQKVNPNIIALLITLFKTYKHNNEIQQLVDDILFMVEKRCGCEFMSDVLPKLLMTKSEQIQVLCIHNDKQTKTIKSTIQSNLLTENEQYSMREFVKSQQTIEEFTSENFIQALQKKKRTILVLEVSSPQGNLRIAINTSDPWVYKSQNDHSDTDQVVNGAFVFYYQNIVKQLTTRSNSDSNIFVFDDEGKSVYSSVMQVGKDVKHPNNTKNFIEIMTSSLNVLVDGRNIISFNFQTNSNQVTLQCLDSKWGQDLMIISCEVLVLDEVANQIQEQVTSIFNEFTHPFTVSEVTVSSIPLDELKILIPDLVTTQSLITNVYCEQCPLEATNPSYPMANVIAGQFHELIDQLSLMCNSTSRPNVQILLFDLKTLNYNPSWAYSALTQLNGRFMYNVIQMAILPVPDGCNTIEIFHQTILAAYQAVSEVNNSQEIWEQTLIRAQQYFDTELPIKQTPNQKKQLQLEKQLQKQLDKQLDKIPKSQSVQKSKGIKGIGYGDINQKLVATEEKVITRKVVINAYESDKLLGVDQYRWDMMKILLSLMNRLLNESKRLLDHMTYSICPSLIYAMLKSSSISEMLSLHRIPSYEVLLDIVSQMDIDELNSVLMDREYGGNDSDQCIYTLLKRNNDESVFYGDNFTHPQELLPKQKEFLKRFQETTKVIETALELNEFVRVTYEDQYQATNQINLSQFYNSLMKNLILGQCSILSQAGYQAQMSQYANATGTPSKSKLDRIIMELGTLTSSLPCESSNSIFLRYDRERVDVMRTLILGASGTPYAHGAFLYNMHFGDDYPQRPPKCLLETTGHGKVRFNPNLYACGKVCLSLLGTWGDNWIPHVSTLLQILISIQSMVMSEYVYFNEPGWEHQMGTNEGDRKNRGYCNIVKLANIRYAMIEQIREPPMEMEDIVHRSFYLRSDLIMKEVSSWIDEADLDADYSGSQNHNISQPFQLDPSRYKQVLTSEVKELEKELEKLKLKMQGKLNLSSTKRTVIPNYEAKRASRQDRLDSVALKKQDLQQLLSRPLELVDVSWDRMPAERRIFNAESAEVQSLMSRYIGVMGIDSVVKQAQASVLVFGMSAVGVEAAKNLVLSGLGRLTLADCHKERSLDGQIYLNSHNGSLFQNSNKLSQLNPYVQVDIDEGDEFLSDIASSPYHASKYNVVVVSEYLDYEQLFKIADICGRSNTALIVGECRSIYSRVMVNLGSVFTVYDKDGDTPLEVHIDGIDGQGVVTLPKGQKHTLQDGDVVILREVECRGDEELKDLNAQEFKVTVLNRSQFSIGDLSGFRPYERNGIAHSVKQKTIVIGGAIQEATSVSKVRWDSTMSTMFTEESLIARDVVQLLLDCYYRWISIQQRQPQSIEDKIDLFQYTSQSNLWQELNHKYSMKQTVDKYPLYLEQTLQFCLTSEGFVHAQAAYTGAIIAQETLKAITHKYMPITQVYVHDCAELCAFRLQDLTPFIQPTVTSLSLYYGKIVGPLNITYAQQQQVIGSELLDTIQAAHVFMVGAGAIGCELLKNFAMVGLCANGCLVLTDPDLIEHSNLSRQFLFREKHIRKPKSSTAANAILQMNTSLQGHIVAMLEKVCPATQNTFNDYFYDKMDVVVNALDNVEARLYIDSRCVTNSTPLVESGTLGPKGHVQVILPNLTESYGSQRDPEETNEIPYCTLKMFPEDTLHCLEWARDKFENIFYNKPQIVRTVISNLTKPLPIQVSQLEITLRLLRKKPTDFHQCLQYAKNKYQKFFQNGILQLLQAYPLDQADEKGKLFWSSPKRPPMINKFDPSDANKLKFVISAAILWADVHNVPIDNELLQDSARLVEVLNLIQVSEFRMDSIKLMQIQKQVDKQQSENTQDKQIDNETQQESLQQASAGQLTLQILGILSEYFEFNDKPDDLKITLLKPLDGQVLPNPTPFEKDDDSNRHIDFIQSATNCRAGNYKLEAMDWLQVKIKAGRIVPAMATTTASISALQTIETIKVLKKGNALNSFRNTFLNLAVPFSMHSEPGECSRVKIGEKDINLWTCWNIQLTRLNKSVGGLIQYMEREYQLGITAIKQGAKPIYLPLMFVGRDEVERERYLSKPITSLVDYQVNDEYVEIDVSFSSDGVELKQSPRIRLIL